MKEVKPPKKPLIYYYGVALVVLLLINFLLVPLVARHAVQEVDYGTFMTMTENKEIGQVEVEDNQIIFTNKDGSKIYKTGPMNDPDLTQRLYDAGAEFTRDIVEETSPLLSFVLTWILPIIIFIAIGQLMTKKLTDRAGGPGSMMFGAGKSNAKIYVQSTQGIHFSDVAGEDEAKENLQEIVNYLHDPGKYQEIGASMPKGILLWAFEGLQRLAANNFKFTESDRTRENREAVKRDNNNVYDFLDSDGYVRLKADLSASSKELYEAYQIYCTENNLPALKPRSFSEALIACQSRYNLEYCNNVTNAAGRRVRGFLGIEVLVRNHISVFSGDSMRTYVPEDVPEEWRR